MKKRSLTYLIVIVILTLIVSFIVIPKYRIGGSLYTVESADLEVNFKSNTKKFYDLKHFLDSLYPDHGFYLGYDGSNHRYRLGISRLEWSTYNTIAKSEVTYFRANGFKLNSTQLSIILDSINLDEKQFNQIIEKFKATNCTFFSKHILKYKPFYLTYGYDNTFLLQVCFSYHIFDTDVSDAIKTRWGKHEGMTKYNDFVYFEYGYPL
jgi:hypothetical protein